MFLLRRIPALIAVLMLGALSLRLGMAHWAALFLTSVLLALLFVPRAIPQVAALAALWTGCLAWVGMAWLRVSERLALGLPWLRLVFIFGAVTAFTAWAAWLLRTTKS